MYIVGNEEYLQAVNYIESLISKGILNLTGLEKQQLQIITNAIEAYHKRSASISDDRLISQSGAH